MIKEAKRQAVPLMIGIAGTSGSGKTYSALLIAAGLAGKSGKVGLLDTELGRGAMYADDPDIKIAMPGGKYYISDLTEPFSPAKYSQAIKEFIKFGVNVLVIDSATHEWEGFGGCQDIAANNKLAGNPNWALAKMEHKRLMNMLTQCPMHIIFCLRAREKTKIMKNPNTGKMEYVQQGLQAIQEGNFMYEMTLSMMLDNDNPGIPQMTKCPKALIPLFDKQFLITKNFGEAILEYSNGGDPVDAGLRNTKRECREKAMLGNAELVRYWNSLKQEERDLLNKDVNFKEETRTLANEADRIKNEQLNEIEQKTLGIE